MPEMMRKLDHFTATILAEATAETEHALSELKAKRAAAHAAAEERILQEAYVFIQTEVGRIKAEQGRLISRHMLENKRVLFLRRGEISKEVFSLVRERIAAYVRTPAYRERLAALYRESMDKIGEAADVQVFLRREDMDLVPAIQKAVPGQKAAFLEGDFYLGGLTAQSLTRGLRLDSSFDSAIAALDGHFAELFGISVADA